MQKQTLTEPSVNSKLTGPETNGTPFALSSSTAAGRSSTTSAKWQEPTDPMGVT